MPSTPSRPGTPGSLIGRNCILAGRVFYADNYKGAEKVLVRVFLNRIPIIQVFTDSVGRYEARNLSLDIYDVEVNVDGYKPAWAQVDLSNSCRGEMMPILLERATEEDNPAPGTMVSVTELAVPDKARKAFEKGVKELHDKHRPERSLPLFREAIAFYPDYDLAYMQLGVAYASLRQFPAAQQQLEKATALNDKNPRAFVLLGIVLARQGQPAESLKALREAVRLDKDDWLGHFELSRALLKAGLIEEAYKYAQRAHLLKPDVPGVHLLVHDISVRRGDEQTALAEVKEFLQLFPGNPLAPKARKQQESLALSLSAKP